jgi:four helix bundle protein
MNVFRFLDWPMYIDAKKLNQKIGKISKNFSIEVKKKYYSQFNRASLSVSLNIAEAAGRYSDTEMCRYFDIALGSLAEIVACSDNLKDENCLSQSEFDEIYNDAEHIAKQIQGMKYNVYKNPRKFKKCIKNVR